MSEEAPMEPTVEETGLHIIIKGELHDVELYPILNDLSGCAVVEHQEGFVQKERPHYHVWIPIVDVRTTHEREYKALLRTYYDSKISGLKWKTHANSYYCVKKHTSYTAWERYVARDPEVKIATWIKWNRSGTPPSLERIHVLVGADTTSQIVSRPKKDPCHLRFYEHLTRQEITDELTITEIEEYFIRWTCGAYELRNVSAPIRYAWYMLQTDKTNATQRLVREMSRKIFSDF